MKFWNKFWPGIFYNKLSLYLFSKRYFKYKNKPSLKIGFLRLSNEQNTIIPSLMSVDYMFDKIVVIYSDITDNSLNLLHDYVEKNNLKEKYVIEKYPYNVYPPHHNIYFSKFSVFISYLNKSLLSDYYNFGFNICKRLAKGHNGFVAKIDADQIYLPDCFLEIEKIMEKEHYAYLVNPYGGFDGHVKDNEYKIDYSHNAAGCNGTLADHIIIPFSLINFTFFNMEIKNKPYRVAWEHFQHPMLWLGLKKQVENIIWFHFDRKVPYKPADLKNLTVEQKALYYKNIYPLLVKSNSPYKDLIIA